MANTLMDFAKELLSSVGQVSKPMFTSPFTDPAAYRASPEAAAYYADPFRQQKAIEQAALDEALKQKEVEKVQGMLSGDIGGQDQDLNEYVAAFLAAENPTEKEARLGAFSKGALGMLTGGIPLSSNFATMLGLNSTAGMQGQLAAQYGNYLTQPSIVQNIMNSVAPGRVSAMQNAYMANLNQQAEEELAGLQAAAAAEFASENAGNVYGGGLGASGIGTGSTTGGLTENDNMGIWA